MKAGRSFHDGESYGLVDVDLSKILPAAQIFRVRLNLTLEKLVFELLLIFVKLRFIKILDISLSVIPIHATGLFLSFLKTSENR